tara:strand:+ start:1288 stop:1518 length:231 start_codon:yes stop_codon:yes gene_type:complete
MREVTLYKTVDSKIHNSEEQAKRHETDLLCVKTEQFIDSYFGLAHRPSVIKAVTALEENKALAIAQLEELLYILKG